MRNFRPDRSLRPALVAVLLLSSAMTPPHLAVSQAMASANDIETPGWRAYASSSYGYCDAVVLSKLWKTDIGDAKVRIGLKTLAHAERAIDQLLGEAYSHDRCHQSLNFNDSVNVAELWAASEIG